MKRRTILATLALAALPMLADDFRVPGANRLDFLTGYLTLTDAQKAQAKTIFDAADAATTTARGEESTGRTTAASEGPVPRVPHSGLTTEPPCTSAANISWVMRTPGGISSHPDSSITELSRKGPAAADSWSGGCRSLVLENVRRMPS